MLRIAGTASDSIVDGPGLRFTIFTQGCPHHCKGCHNPQTWDFSGGTPADLEQLYQSIVSNPILSGVTLSGGEPFAQAAELLPLVKRLKDAKIEVVAYSGYTFEELFHADDEKRELLLLCDTLVDGKFLLEQRSLDLKFKGSKNQRIINVQKSIAQGHVVLEDSERWNGC